MRVYILFSLIKYINLYIYNTACLFSFFVVVVVFKTGILMLQLWLRCWLTSGIMLCGWAGMFWVGISGIIFRSSLGGLLCRLSVGLVTSWSWLFMFKVSSLKMSYLLCLQIFQRRLTETFPMYKLLKVCILRLKH